MNGQTRFRRVGTFVMLVAALASIGGAMIVLLMAFRAAEQTALDRETRRHLVALAVVAGALLIFALFCVGLLLIRFLAFRLRAPRVPTGPTEYVNAWELAGQRLTLPDEDHEEAAEDESG